MADFQIARRLWVAVAVASLATAQSLIPNFLADPDINPLANPSINPLVNPTINPLADPSIDPLANPSINPLASKSIIDPIGFAGEVFSEAFGLKPATSTTSAASVAAAPPPAIVTSTTTTTSSSVVITTTTSTSIPVAAPTQPAPVPPQTTTTSSSTRAIVTQPPAVPATTMAAAVSAVPIIAPAPAPGAVGAATGPAPAPLQQKEHDPADGAFPGGFPSAIPDVPVTIVFLLMFVTGAITHISIYRANAKRGHKFLLSDLMFDFCTIRTLTCIFRIIWSFIHPRGVVLFALIFENGGAAVIFIVNLFFAQRIFRSIHPTIGWHPLFKFATLGLIWSVPAVIVMNIILLSVSFFSVGNDTQLNAIEKGLIFGASWNMMLCTMPLLMLFVAAIIPTDKRPEQFGVGHLPQKIAVLAYGSATLAVGAAVRLTVATNPAPPDNKLDIFGKAVFYTTGFMLEIFVVALYAAVRIDLLFHIPNGSSAPGDYSAGSKVQATKGLAEMQYDIEESLGLLGVEYATINAPFKVDENTEIVIAKLYIQKSPPDFSSDGSTSMSEKDSEEWAPPRPNRVSRRQTIIDAINPPPRPPRPDRRSRYTQAGRNGPDLPVGLSYYGVQNTPQTSQYPLPPDGPLPDLPHPGTMTNFVESAGKF